MKELLRSVVFSTIFEVLKSEIGNSNFTKDLLDWSLTYKVVWIIELKLLEILKHNNLCILVYKSVSNVSPVSSVLNNNLLVHSERIFVLLIFSEIICY